MEFKNNIFSKVILAHSLTSCHTYIFWNHLSHGRWPTVMTYFLLLPFIKLVLRRYKLIYSNAFALFCWMSNFEVCCVLITQYGTVFYSLIQIWRILSTKIPVVARYFSNKNVSIKVLTNTGSLIQNVSPIINFLKNNRTAKIVNDLYNVSCLCWIFFLSPLEKKFC